MQKIFVYSLYQTRNGLREKRGRERWLLYFTRLLAVMWLLVLCLFLTVLWVSLQCAIVAFPGHTHSLKWPIQNHWIRNSCTMGQKLIYLAHVIFPMQAVTRGLFIGCIGTHSHGHQVTSMFSQSDVIM